jgi:two-component system, cell cycle sensor histidine kinase and response regulator CckA
MLKDIQDGPIPHETILVVDDEPYIRELVCTIFSIAGYTALQAKDGPAALEIAGKHADRIDMLLTDVVMPGMNGKQLWDRFRATRPATRVLFISGFPAEVLSQQGLREGSFPLLPKPFTPKTLLARVREVLEPLPCP